MPPAPIAPPPAAPPAATPTATPPPAGEKSATENFDSAFDDLDAAPGPTPTPAPAPTPTPKPGTPPAKPAAPPAAKKPEDGEEVDGVRVPAFKTNKEFKMWGVRGYKEATESREKLTAAEARLVELEKMVPQNKEQFEAIQAAKTSAEKRIADYESELRLLRYEKSDEYKTKYQKPYEASIARAIDQVKELLVTEADPTGATDDEGKPKLVDRAATRADFERIYQLPLGQATKEAKKMFGDAASIVLGHREKIRDLANAAVEAVKDYREKGEQHEKEQLAQRTSEEGQIAAHWTNVNQKISEDPRAKDFWGDQGDDKEANAELAKGFALADRRFSDEYQQMPMQDKVLLDAIIRHRVAGFSLLKYKNTKLRAEIEQLKKDNAELRGSGPGTPTPGGEPPTGDDEKSPTEKFDSLPG